ncbi:hypothetical protein [Phenylobacterium sp.]|uniref:hypothetical protein n=1 Tax=Phenylobacterium sp. TaxID=1871053 RepID=UPI003BAC84F0
MSVRRELYEILAKLPGGNPALRIVATGAYLDGLPADEAEIVARRMLALAKAMASDTALRPGATMDELFDLADEIEKVLKN